MNKITITALLERFPHMRFHPELDLLVWHPCGTLDDQLFDDILLVLESEELSEEGLVHRIYTDFNCFERINLNLDRLSHYAERRRTASSPRKSALFADSPIGFGIAQLYERFMKFALIHVRAFRDRGDAAAWLGVPVEILEPATISEPESP